MGIGLALNAVTMWDFLKERPEVLVMRQRLKNPWARHITNPEKEAKARRRPRGRQCSRPYRYWRRPDGGDRSGRRPRSPPGGGQPVSRARRQNDLNEKRYQEMRRRNQLRTQVPIDYKPKANCIIPASGNPTAMGFGGPEAGFYGSSAPGGRWPHVGHVGGGHG